MSRLTRLERARRARRERPVDPERIHVEAQALADALGLDRDTLLREAEHILGGGPAVDVDQVPPEQVERMMGIMREAGARFERLRRL